MTPREQHRADMERIAGLIMGGARAGTIILTPLEREIAEIAGFFGPGNVVVDNGPAGLPVRIISLDEIPIILLTPDGPT